MTSTAAPLLTSRIYLVDIKVLPIAMAWSFPSMYRATIVPFSTSTIDDAGWVSPGAITFAPALH